MNDLFRNDLEMDNNYWFSLNVNPLSNRCRNPDLNHPFNDCDCHLFRSQHIIGSATQKWRIESNECLQRRQELKPKFNSEFKKDSNKRSIDCTEDNNRMKRSRIEESLSCFNSKQTLVQDFRQNYTNEYNSKDLGIDLFCKTCNSFSHSFKDFANHLNGKRHKSNLSNQSKPTNPCNELQTMLDKAKEPVIGLDFIKEVKPDLIHEIGFSCHLCKCYKLSIYSTFQHILGFRHRFNFAKFIDSDKRQLFSGSESRQKENSIIVSLTQKYECLYGRGNVRFIRRQYERRDNENRKASPFHFNDIPLDRNQCICESSPKSKDNCLNQKAIESFKEIRKICDQMIYSPKHKSFETNSLMNGSIDNNSKILNKRIPNSSSLDFYSKSGNIITLDSIKNEK